MIQRPDGGVMWDCTPLITDAAIAAINAKGGVKAIAISHPHFYATMVDWSRALGGVPIYLHEDNRDWVMRPDACIEFWSGESKQIADGITLVRTGGHFPGSTVLHWARGRRRQGRADDRRFDHGGARHALGELHVLVPQPHPAQRPGASSASSKSVRAYQFDRIYAGWWDRVLDHDAKAAVQRSAERYIAAIR